jgi:hypothetical protein
VFAQGQMSVKAILRHLIDEIAILLDLVVVQSALRAGPLKRETLRYA